MDMRFGTWNVRSLYRAGSLMTVAKELSKYKLNLVGLQEVRWDRDSTKPAREYTFSV
jgi:exonuclease III